MANYTLNYVHSHSLILNKKIIHNYVLTTCCISPLKSLRQRAEWHTEVTTVFHARSVTTTEKWPRENKLNLHYRHSVTLQKRKRSLFPQYHSLRLHTGNINTYSQVTGDTRILVILQQKQQPAGRCVCLCGGKLADGKNERKVSPKICGLINGATNEVAGKKIRRKLQKVVELRHQLTQSRQCYLPGSKNCDGEFLILIICCHLHRNRSKRSLFFYFRLWLYWVMETWGSFLSSLFAVKERHWSNRWVMNINDELLFWVGSWKQYCGPWSMIDRLLLLLLMLMIFPIT